MMVEVRVTYGHPEPVLTKRSPGAEGIRYGFEGGRVVKVGDTYHLFTSEMAAAPIWVNMRLGHWSSRDKLTWQRQATVRQSSGDITGKDTRAALWSPLPAWDVDNDEWDLFYVAYKSLPNTPQKFLVNHDGRICRSASTVKGLEGISGPFEDRGIVMEPGPFSQPWEGLQGVDSFFPWKVGGHWHAFYGSARSETRPVEYWRVGLASAPALAGPWTRDPKNPSDIETYDIENPIVTEVPGKGWLVVYDQVQALDSFGWAFSWDGTNWPKGSQVQLGSSWCKQVRTPMGLVDEGGGKFTLFYTGFETTPDWDQLLAGSGEHSCAIGYVELEIL
jgi:hypothetical protein